MYRWAAILSVLVVVDQSAVAMAQTTTTGPVPSPWLYADVGAVGVPGNASATYSNGSPEMFTVQAAGSDIWGTSDSFGYVYQPLTGDGWVAVNVLSLQNTSAYAKVGLMLRESLDPSSPTVILDLRPTGDIEFMHRSASGEAMQFVASASQSQWLQLYRDGSTVTAVVFDGATQKNVAIGTVTITMGRTLLVGLAVTSHDATQLTTAQTRPPFVHTYSTGPFPDSYWYDRDIGSVGQTGGAAYTHGVFTVSGAGSDIWGTADSFHMIAHNVYSSDAEIVARVTSVGNTNPFAKAGIDMRLGRGGAPEDSHVILDVRPTGDIEFMTRSQIGSETTYLAGAGQSVPVWLKLARSGTTISGYVSTDGLSWTLLGTTTPDWAGMNAGDGWVTAALVVCSHDTSTVNTSTFDNVAIIDNSHGLPVPWLNSDVGSTGVAGSASWAAGTFSVSGAGADIWGTSDAFHFVYQSFVCGCPGVVTEEYSARHVQVVARVTGIQNTNAFAKAGVMLRSGTTLDPSAAHVILDVRPTGDIEFMTRTAEGASTTYIAGAQATSAVWLKLVRVDDAVTGYVSTDGTNWIAVRTATPMLSNDAFEAGMVVTSHDPSTLNLGTFDNAEVEIPR